MLADPARIRNILRNVSEREGPKLSEEEIFSGADWVCDQFANTMSENIQLMERVFDRKILKNE